ncbi:MAG: alcohol dehydrogenase catalytic domain-containing protein, partial [Candidatus Bathyarchaeia archaeon]
MGTGLTLKAALVDSQGRLQLANVDLPRIGREDLLVKMRVCGICGTDLEKLQGVRVTPPVLGHEAVGDVEEVGAGTEGYSRGDRVAVHHHVPCHVCYYCLHGDHTMCHEFPKSNLDPCGFAEYFRVPETNVSKGAVFRLPHATSYEEAALAEPTGCCIRGLDKLGMQQEDSVLIIGAGPAGLTYIQLLRALGNHLILATDMIESRLRWAKKFGADEALNATDTSTSKRVLDATQGRGVDNVIVASGSVKAIQSSFSLVRKGGRILLFGIPPERSMFTWDASSIFIRETKLIPSYSTTENEIERALQ